MKTRDFIFFYLNGKPNRVTGEECFENLSTHLRNSRHLTGTKVVCAEGDCGACTVMVGRPNSSDGYQALNSCILPLASVDGCSVVTVEGVGTEAQPSEVQASMCRNFGAQCGFCTPGFVMSLTQMFECEKNIKESDVKNHLTGNLCRCTGYKPIIQAALDVDTSKLQKISKIFPIKNVENDFKVFSKLPLLVECTHRTLFGPLNIRNAAQFKLKNPQSVILGGSTDLGVQINKGKTDPKKFISLHNIDDLKGIKLVGRQVTVGARVSLSELEKFLKNKASHISEFFRIFASLQIKNSATLAGNVANASPIADTPGWLLLCEGAVNVVGPDTSRKIQLSDFVLGYKKTSLKKGEIIKSISFEIPKTTSKFRLFKISQRRDLDISCINAGFLFDIKDGIICDAKVVYGGVGATICRLEKVEKFLKNKVWSEALALETKELIASCIKPISDLRGSGEFRKKLALRLFDRFAAECLS